MAKAGLCVLISILVMTPLAARLCRSGGPSASERDAASHRFVIPGANPEPGERAAFLGCVLGLPVLIFATTALLGRLDATWRPEAPSWSRDLTGLALLGLAVGVGIVGVRREHGYHLMMNAFYQSPAWSIPWLVASLGLLGWGRRGGRGVRVLTHSLAVATFVAMGLACVFDESDRYALGVHFTAVFHPVAQVVLGKTVLVDLASQYGLYPEFLALVFAISGLNVLKFTIVMGLLATAVLGALWAFLRGATRNPVVALIGFLALVANSSFCLIEIDDLYFQYMPIRMVFPAASVWLSWRYASRPSRQRYWSTMVVLGIGPLWNLDSGVPALASWLAMLGYRELAEPSSAGRRLCRIAVHLGVGLMATAAALLAYSAFAAVRTSHLPDFRGFVAFQRIFYGSGFFMIPMPTVGGWCVVALIELAGLAFAAQAMVSKRVTERSAVVFQLSVLGVGLFAYYQGRSHPRVLTLAWWPSVLLLTLFLDDLIADLQRTPGRLPRLAWSAVLVWILAGSAWSLTSLPGFLGLWYESHLFAAWTHRSPGTKVAAERLKRLLRPEERLLVISPNEALLGLRLQRPSAWKSSLVESILVDDFREMAGRVRRGEFDRIYIDRSVLHPRYMANRGLAELAEVVRQGRWIATTPEGLLLRPGDGPPAGLSRLLDPKATRLHVSYIEAFEDWRLPEPPMALGDRFTIEAVIKPRGDQNPLATIVGNQPGASQLPAGFSIEQEGPDASRYVLLAGDGLRFNPIARFRLEPERWNYVAIAVDDGQATTYLDGQPVEHRDVPNPMVHAESGQPVIVGNWIGGDRPFRGQIAEVRISDELVARDEVPQRWASVRRSLEQTAEREPRARR